MSTSCAIVALYSRNRAFLIGPCLIQPCNSHVVINYKASVLTEDIWASLRATQNIRLEKYQILSSVALKCWFQKSLSALEHAEKIGQARTRENICEIQPRLSRWERCLMSRDNEDCTFLFHFSSSSLWRFPYWNRYLPSRRRSPVHIICGSHFIKQQWLLFNFQW